MTDTTIECSTEGGCPPPEPVTTIECSTEGGCPPPSNGLETTPETPNTVETTPGITPTTIETTPETVATTIEVTPASFAGELPATGFESTLVFVAVAFTTLGAAVMRVARR